MTRKARNKLFCSLAVGCGLAVRPVARAAEPVTPSWSTWGGVVPGVERFVWVGVPTGYRLGGAFYRASPHPLLKCIHVSLLVDVRKSTHLEPGGTYLPDCRTPRAEGS